MTIKIHSLLKVAILILEKISAEIHILSHPNFCFDLTDAS